MKLSLTGFQDAFVDALYGVESAPMAQLSEQPGFSVYRNTVMKGCIDALSANFPTIERLVGSEWFRAAAAIHVNASPPSDARLLNYGEAFPAFLDDFEHAQQMPYLGNVARLDRCWSQVHVALDEPSIDLAALGTVAPDDMGRLLLTPRAAATWRWFVDQPAYTLWRINREQLEMPENLDWIGEGALLIRSAGRVTWQAVSAADCLFLDACVAGLPLEQAAERAMELNPALDISDLLTRLVTADVFASAVVEPR